MKTLVIVLILLLSGLCAAVELDRECRPPTISTSHIWNDELPPGAIYLLGGPGSPEGSFELSLGNCWTNWTSIDYTVDNETHWQVSTFNAEGINGHPAGNHAMWCGQYFDDDPGYGNHWNTQLVWVWQVPDPLQISEFELAAHVRHDTEPACDFLFFEIMRGGIGTWEILYSISGSGNDVLVEITTNVLPEDYTGNGGDEIWCRWRFQSDSAYSDEDGYWDTNGACQIDDISIHINDELVSFTDFESGNGGWVEYYDWSVGNFMQLWSDLGDIDIYRSNSTCQVAFIDDGDVVPGTGGTWCITWCYGPGGMGVNCEGGLAGPDHHLDNAIISPPIEWYTEMNDAILGFDVYVHDRLHEYYPGIFYSWAVRSTTDPDPAALEAAPWLSNGTVYAGGPEYRRHREDIGSLLEQGLQYLQVQLRVSELGWLWGWYGTDTTPAPYFDNVVVASYERYGPIIATRDEWQAQDAFPTQGFLNLANLASNHCRFDRGAIEGGVHGDGIIFDIKTLIPGFDIADYPVLRYVIKTNPTFDSVRQWPEDWVDLGDNRYEGLVEGALMPPVPDRFTFDLPDENVLYPGDVIHYYVEATEVGGFNYTETWPSDVSHVADFTEIPIYPEEATMRCLPTVTSAQREHPRILVWNDAGEDLPGHWWYGLGANGLVCGVGFDLFRSRRGASNGLGDRASLSLLANYEVLVYNSGYEIVHTLADEDIELLNDWYDTYSARGATFWGNNLAYDLHYASAAGQAFLANRLGAHYVADNVAPLIEYQHNPIVRAQPIWISDVYDEWQLFDSYSFQCWYDAVETASGMFEVARFCEDPPQDCDSYPYAAATAVLGPGDIPQTLFFPYCYEDIQSPPGWVQPPTRTAPIPFRAYLLRDAFEFVGYDDFAEPVAVPGRDALAVNAYPNPFNPRTTIDLNLPRPGQVALRLYDLRGRLVRTLHDGELPAGSHKLVWDATDEDGRGVAAGVYFYKLKANQEVKFGKLALIK